MAALLSSAILVLWVVNIILGYKSLRYEGWLYLLFSSLLEAIVMIMVGVVVCALIFLVVTPLV